MKTTITALCNQKGSESILPDCTPLAGGHKVNALAAANSALVPVQVQYLSAKGPEQMIGTIAKMRRRIERQGRYVH